MVVHHLNCGTMCPIGGRLFNGPPSKLVCHCLLIESESGLILVDTGLGMEDVQRPRGRVAPGTFLFRPRLDPEETALRQVERMGYSAKDVRHIVLTHLDYDHAGGLSDFPHARVHVFGAEFVAAMAPATLKERLRYRPVHWAHSPDWALYKAGGEPWFGFECVRELKGLPPEILLVPLTGHTWGHCGVAVETGDSWLLHAGDAYFFHGEMNDRKPRCPPGLRSFQRLVEVDSDSRIQNQIRLRRLAHEQEGRVRVFSAHDPVELSRSFPVPRTGETANLADFASTLHER